MGFYFYQIVILNRKNNAQYTKINRYKVTDKMKIVDSQRKKR